MDVVVHARWYMRVVVHVRCTRNTCAEWMSRGFAIQSIRCQRRIHKSKLMIASVAPIKDNQWEASKTFVKAQNLDDGNVTNG